MKEIDPKAKVILDEFEAQQALYVDQHRLKPGHTPESPRPKQTPNYGADRRSQKVFAMADGQVWIPNGRIDNPPPGVDPEKWEIMSRKRRREFAAKALRKYA